jgi:hypothetical protein
MKSRYEILDSMESVIATAATLMDAMNAAEEYTAEHSDTAMIYDTTRQMVIHTSSRRWNVIE